MDSARNAGNKSLTLDYTAQNEMKSGAKKGFLWICTLLGRTRSQDRQIGNNGRTSVAPSKLAESIPAEQPPLSLAQCPVVQ
jgi:hypothetical protein